MTEEVGEGAGEGAGQGEQLEVARSLAARHVIQDKGMIECHSNHKYVSGKHMRTH